jgi:uncharacterized repeat protein (TIGR03803 family)
MDKRVWVGFAAARMLGIVVAIILLVLAGRTFNACGQTETNLYSFGSFPNDGGYPQAGLVQGSDGNFYGTTEYDGTNNNGTVFRISPSGICTTLYSFVGYPTDGGNPSARLVQGSDSSFYGTTEYDGTNNNGTVFRISASGTYTNLYSFGSRPNDGAYPVAGLVLGSDGNFYGTTSSGGTSNNGTVFRISPSGTCTNLHSFIGSPNDGSFPYAGLVQGSDGNFYGTTEGGGTFGVGTVYRISPSGTCTSLYSFGSSPSDGDFTHDGLVQGSDGNFYGTASDGGTGLFHCGDFGCGTIFRISPSSVCTNLYTFGNFAGDGVRPQSGLVQGSDGDFYGTTAEGGTYGNGTVFKLTVPLSPPPYPINQITSAQIATPNIIFTIPSIAYETYQLQFSSSMNPPNWVNVPSVSVTNSIGALLTLTNFGGAVGPQGFYRFDITP